MSRTTVRAAQSLNERSVAWLLKPNALFPSFGYDLLKDLGGFGYVPGITIPEDGELVEQNASKCVDLCGGYRLQYEQLYEERKPEVEPPKTHSNKVTPKAPPHVPEFGGSKKPDFPAGFTVPLLSSGVCIPQIDDVGAAQSADRGRIAAPKVPPTPPKPQIAAPKVPPTPPKPQYKNKNSMDLAFGEVDEAWRASPALQCWRNEAWPAIA